MTGLRKSKVGSQKSEVSWKYFRLTFHFWLQTLDFLRQVRDPGFTTGTPCAHSGQADCSYVGRLTTARDANCVLSEAVPPLRSTIEPAPTTCAPAASATAMVSRVEPPVVTTSSMTSTRSVGASGNRRSISLPSWRSANVA